MEELQDAIEDAQYVNAMTDDGPKPSKEWAYPDKESIAAWRATKGEDYFDILSLFQQALCLYIFSRFCKEENPAGAGVPNAWATKVMFCEDCSKYVKMFGDKARKQQAAVIVETYLTGSGHPPVIELTDSNLERHLNKLSSSECAKLADETCGKGSNPLGVGGALYDSAMSAVSSNQYTDTLFEKLEAAVMHSLLAEVQEKFVACHLYEKMLQFLYLQEAKVDEDDFALFRVLGRGGFGMVNGCKKCTSGKLYAMKVMNKKRVKIKKSEQLTLNERVALAAVESPFVVNLKYAFTSEMDLFLIMDLMTGGDLSFHLAQKRRFNAEECHYYAARIMLGCQALHDQKYVYRDLKPENILMGEDGRVKITDLGLACKITPTLHGAAGTRGYWAPEMLLRDDKGKKMPYGHCVDWWSFGCMLAEFISGVCPFRSEAALKFGQDQGKTEKEKAIDEATLKMDPEWDPEHFDDVSKDLCKKLCTKDPKTRLGYNGVEEIMRHPYFKDTDWELIKSDRLIPPYIPPKDVNAASQSEIGQFSEDKVFKKTGLDEKDHLVYKDWNWTNKKAFQTEVIEFLMYEKTLGRPLTPPKAGGGGCCTVS